MARPIKSGLEKAVVVSVSCSPAQKEMLDRKGISPSKLFQQALLNLENSSNGVGQIAETEKDIEILRKYYVQGLRPSGDMQIYLKAIEMFLQKYPDWTKAEVMQRAERPRHVKLEETTIEEGVASGV